MHYPRHIFSIAFLIGVLPFALVAGEPPATRPADSGAATPAPSKLSVPELKTQFWFGVAVENIPPAIARQLKLKPSQGLMVSAVLPNSPAERAGLKAEDLLIEINGRPLTAQEDLFVAANSMEQAKSGTAVKVSRLTYLREGDRTTVEITPEQRPAGMIVFESPNKPHGPKFRNYVTPNGGGAQVGTGYRMNLDTASPGDVTMKSIKAIVSKGQTIVLSQETDLAGGVTNTITLGTTVYTVDPNHIEALPADLQAIAQQIVGGASASAPAPARTGTAPVSLEQRVKELEAQNAELKKQMQEFIRQHGVETPGK